MIPRIWTPEELEYIKNHCSYMTDGELAKNLNDIYENRRTFSAVRKARQRMGIQKSSGRGVCKVSDIDEKAVKDKISQNKVAIAKEQDLKVNKEDI